MHVLPAAEGGVVTDKEGDEWAESSPLSLPPDALYACIGISSTQSRYNCAANESHHSSRTHISLSLSRNLSLPASEIFHQDCTVAGRPLSLHPIRPDHQPIIYSRSPPSPFLVLSLEPPPTRARQPDQRPLTHSRVSLGTTILSSSSRSRKSQKRAMTASRRARR